MRVIRLGSRKKNVLLNLKEEERMFSFKDL